MVYMNECFRKLPVYQDQLIKSTVRLALLQVSQILSQSNSRRDASISEQVEK